MPCLANYFKQLWSSVCLFNCLFFIFWRTSIHWTKVSLLRFLSLFVQIGDRIIKICGTSAEGMSHSQAVSLLKNATGTIHLQVSQNAHTQIHKYTYFRTTFVFLTNKAADGEIICCCLFILSVEDEQQINQEALAHLCRRAFSLLSRQQIESTA